MIDGVELTPKDASLTLPAPFATVEAQGGRVVFDIEAGKELAAHFPTGKAAIHQNHGLFTVGQTVDETAFWFD